MAHSAKPWFKPRTSARRVESRARFQTLLGLEPLESRELLTVSFGVAGNVLTISTDDGADTLTLQSDGTNLKFGGTAAGSVALNTFTSIKVDNSAGQRFASVDVQGGNLSGEAVSIDATAVGFTTAAVSVASLVVDSQNGITQDAVAGITSSGAISFTASSNVLIDGALDASGQSIFLTGTNVIQDSTTGSIKAASLEGVAVGNFNTASSTNAVGVLAGSTSVGIFNFRNSTSLSIGTVGGSVGIAAESAVQIIVEGTGNTLTVSKAVTSTSGGVVLRAPGTVTVSANVSGADVLLESASAQVAQTGGTISATRLEIGAATGAVLNQTNSFDKIAGQITGTGDFEVRSNKGTGFSVVDETGSGGSFAGITTNNGNVTLRTIGTGKTITVSAPITAGGSGSTVLLKADNFDFDGAQAITATNAELQTVGPAAGLSLGVGTMTNTELDAFNVTNLNINSNGTATVSSNVDLSGDVSALLSFQANVVNVQADLKANSSGTIRFSGGDITFASTVNISAKAIEFSPSNNISFTNSAGAGGLDFSQTDLNTFDETVVDTVRFSSGFGTISFTNGAIDFANGQVTKAGGAIVLKASSTVTQAAGATIKATNLAVLGSSVTLQQSNDVDVLAGSATTNFKFKDSDDLQIGSVDVNDATLNPRGIGTTGVSAALVHIEAGGALTQTATGAIKADSVAAVGGDVDLTTATNVASTAGTALTIAGKATTGDFKFTAAEADGLTVGTVDGVIGVTVDSAGKAVHLTNTAGAITQGAAGVGDITADFVAAVGTSVDLSTATNVAKTAATAITVAGQATTGGFKFTAAEADGLSIGTADGVVGVTVDATGEFAHFVNSAGAVSQAAGAAGAITADLVAAEGTSVDLTAGTNTAKTAATALTLAGVASTGGFKFTAAEADGLTIGTVDSVVGVTVSGADQFAHLKNSAGALTQTSIITADQVAAEGVSVALTGANMASSAAKAQTIAGTTTTGDFAYTSAEADGLVVGAVDGVVGITSPNAVNATVTASAGNLTISQNIATSPAAGALANVQLNSTGGAVTQTAGAVNGAVVGVTAGGAVNLQGGSITSANLSVTSGGAVNQSAGTIVATKATFSPTGAFNQTGGTITSPDLTVKAGGAISIGGTVDLGLGTGSFDAGAAITVGGTLAFTANNTGDLGQATFLDPVTISGTLAMNFLNTDVLFLADAISPGFQFITNTSAVTIANTAVLGFFFAGAVAPVLSAPTPLNPTVLINDVVVTFQASAAAGFNLAVLNPPISIAGVFNIPATVLTVPAVAPVIAPVVQNTLPSVEQDTAYGQQTNLAGLTVFVKLYSVVGGKKVWVLGGLKTDKDGNLVETGDSLKGTEVLPKLIAVFTETISGKWGEYTLELEEMAPETEGGDAVRRATRTVKATFKFNVKTQQQLIEALRNIQTVEKLFQYFQELPSRGAAPLDPATTGGGANRVDPRRNPAAKLSLVLPKSLDASPAEWVSLDGEFGGVVEVSPDVILTRPEGFDVDFESVSMLSPAAPEAAAQPEAAGDSSTVAGAAVASAAVALGLLGRRRGEDRFEQDLDAMMESFDELRARWN